MNRKEDKNVGWGMLLRKENGIIKGRCHYRKLGENKGGAI